MFETKERNNKATMNIKIAKKEGEKKFEIDKWDHPFADFEPIKEAQALFEEARTDSSISVDNEHFKPNQNLIERAFRKVMDQNGKADLILSDSCTCTKVGMGGKTWLVRI